MEILGLVEIPLWSILLMIATVIGYIYATWTHDTWSKQGVKGPRPLPLIGTFWSALKAGSFPPMDMGLVANYGKISGAFRGKVPSLDVADPEFLRLAMIKDFNKMPNRQRQSFGNIFDLMMTALTDDHWRHVRSSITPTFTSGKLKMMKQRIDTCTEKLVEHVRDTKEAPFDTKSYLGGYTMDVISSTAFGIDVDSQSNPDHPMLIQANRVMGTNKPAHTFLLRMKERILLFVRMFVFILAPKWLFKFIVNRVDRRLIFDMEAIDYFREMTARIIKNREQDGSNEKDFVQLCLNQLIDDPKPGEPGVSVDENGTAWSTKGLTQDEIVANAILFYLAGYETTASTMNWVLYELTMNPEVQEKVLEDINAHKSSDVVTYEELGKMEYLDWVIMEAMRIYPAAPRLDRMVTEETTIQGITLPVGSLVSAMAYAIHHDPELWEDPEKFEPERFTQENREGRHQCAWIPFGVGNRNCIGNRLALLEMKIAFVSLISNFKFVKCDDTPSKPVKFTKNFRMDPEKKIKIRAVQR